MRHTPGGGADLFELFILSIVVIFYEYFNIIGAARSVQSRAYMLSFSYNAVGSILSGIRYLK